MVTDKVPDSTIDIKQLSFSSADFDEQLDQLLAWENISDNQVENVVSDVLLNIRQRGDHALVEYTNRFDRREISCVSELFINSQQLQDALDGLASVEREALLLAA